MILRKLKVKNVYGFSDYEFEYSPGIVGLVGHVGSGKSGFGEVIQYFAITGRTPATIPNKDELISWGEDKGWTEITAEHDGIEYVLKRNLHNSSVTLKWTEGGTTETRKQKEASTIFESMLGMPPEVFYECCFVRQGNLWAILTMSTTERLAYFQRITGTIVAERLRTSLQKHASSLPQFPDRSVELEECRHVLETHNAALVEVEKKKAEYKAKIEKDFPRNLEEVVGELASKITEAEYNSRLQTAKDNVERCERAVTGIEQEIQEKLGQPPAEAEAPEADLTNLHHNWQTQWKEAMASKEASEKALSDAKAILDKPVLDTQSSREEAEKRLKTATDAIAELSAELLDLESRITLAEKGSCPTCGQKYPSDPGELKARRDKKTAKKQAFLDTKTKLDEYIKGLGEKERNDLQTRISAETAQNNAKAVLAVCNDPKYTEYDPAKYEAQLAAYNSWSKYQREYKQFQDTVTARKNALTSAKAALQQAKEYPYMTDSARKELEVYKEQLAALMNSVQKADQRIAELNAVITSQTSLQKSYQRDMDRQADATRKREIIEGARELLHRKSLPKIVMNHLRISLAYEVHRQLLQFDMPYQAELNEDFDYVIHWPNGRDKGVHTLSGGQKVILSICHHLALAKILSDSIPLIFMDEPTNHLGDSEKSLVQQALYAMRKHAGRNTPILVATHEEQLYPAFNSMTEFSRKS